MLTKIAPHLGPRPQVRSKRPASAPARPTLPASGKRPCAVGMPPRKARSAPSQSTRPRTPGAVDKKKNADKKKPGKRARLPQAALLSASETQREQDRDLGQDDRRPAEGGHESLCGHLRRAQRAAKLERIKAAISNQLVFRPKPLDLGVISSTILCMQHALPGVPPSPQPLTRPT